MRNFSQIDFLRLDLHKQEQAAKSVPYVSFILTHAALVLFLVAAFFVDRLVSTPSMNLPVKILLVCLGVLLVAAEWVYAIVTSRRWKHDVIVLLQLEAAQRQREAEEKMRKQEEIIAAEQLRNRVLQADNQRLRTQRGQESFSPTPLRSIRPPNPPAPAYTDMNREPMSFPPARTVRPVSQQQAFPDMPWGQESSPSSRPSRPMNPSSPSLPDANRPPAFPPYPSRESFRTSGGDNPFDPEHPR
jgi:hypothetical protein